MSFFSYGGLCCLPEIFVFTRKKWEIDSVYLIDFFISLGFESEEEVPEQD